VHPILDQLEEIVKESGVSEGLQMKHANWLVQILSTDN
jgi:hypothetical protein